MIEATETPALVLDIQRLNKNAARMAARIASCDVGLRPHMKTAKSIDVARAVLGADKGPITVSTLKEAEYFARAGFDDILYAVAIVPAKLDHVKRIQRETGARLLLTTDSVAAAEALVAAAGEGREALQCLIEIDCGEHRSGVAPASPALAEIAATLAAREGLLGGVMTHAGHSYGTDSIEAIADIAEIERRAAVDSAAMIRAAGLACPVVSIGSTPTILHARSLEGITEARCGIYMFWDLAQYSRGMCGLDDIAVSVLATVIGHNPQAGSMVIDAGALALSKDIGANRFMPDVGYGIVCDCATLQPIGDLRVANVHQEHGTVPVSDPALFSQLPIGKRVRILPNHACMTCAAYDRYHLTGAKAGMTWSRINGW
ncbi:alanine racemase [Martelella sp. HB161492]|uniref:alanine racemase n=1 Tax=Martelella sp. HB161492 TaxID=2720726 RepID=UPI00159031CB|nr:alanine racemase [Martelella sp. HB161492]